jgi:hypothetical protein
MRISRPGRPDSGSRQSVVKYSIREEGAFDLPIEWVPRRSTASAIRRSVHHNGRKQGMLRRSGSQDPEDAIEDATVIDPSHAPWPGA